MKYAYVVVSQPGSLVARIISKVTGDKYAHVSFSLEDDLSEMYSFGRRWSFTPIFGGFVRESVSYGTMKRFRKAEIVVLRIPVSDEKRGEIAEYLAAMWAERKKYHYNYRGVFLARKGRAFHRENYYYCSEFVREVLERFALSDPEEFGEVARPAEFLNLRRAETIYHGRLCDYAETAAALPQEAQAS